MRLRKHEFRAYLQRNLEVPFDRLSPTSCPIACFLTRKDDLDVEAWGDVIEIDGEEFEPPKWASDFIYEWDKHSQRTGKGAIEVLESLG